jgi:hypothetical protein
MKLKFIILILGVIGLCSCSNNQNSEDLKEGITVSQSIEIIWVEVADSLSNFDGLLSTNHLYYLDHMSVDYDNYGKDFWKSIDTVKNDNWVIKRLRKGACQNSTDTSQIGLCIEQQEHTINKKINKVIKFSGNGSGYFATIEYVYDESGNLIEYKDFDKVFFLKYDNKNELTEVLKTQVSHGLKRNTGLIKFKKLSTTKPKLH